MHINFILLIVCSLYLNATEPNNNIRDGKSIYKDCVSCHGIKGDNPALGQSAIINQMDEEQIQKALNGYLDESYGGELKTTMKIETQKLTDNEIKEVAKYIQTLRK